jgi:uncharacterized protein YegL
MAQPVVIAVLDVSGSMSSSASGGYGDSEASLFSRLDLVKHAMNTIIEIYHGHLAIITFSDDANVVFPLTEMKGTTESDNAKAAVESLDTEGSTELWTGFEKALEIVQKIKDQDQPVHIVLLTDGVPNRSDDDVTLEKYLKTHNIRPFYLHCFGFGYSLRTPLLHKFCEMGKGIFGYIPDHTMIGTIFINAISIILTNMKTKSTPDQDEAIKIVTESINKVLKAPNDTREAIVREAIEKVQGLSNKSDFVQDLLIDLDDLDPHKGQILKAVNSAVFERWGKNHLVSYLRALETRLCVNFKDQAIQHFATEEFKEYQEKGNIAFAELPPPISSLGDSTGPVDMTQFNNRYGGCFTQNCLVLMNDGTHKKVQALKKGDKLFGGASIVCVVRTKVDQEKEMVVNGKSLELTWWHPVKCNESQNQWAFPQNVFETKRIQVSEYYNLVLDSVHSIRIDDVEVCTLGHGFTDNQVIQHEFYGTQKVIECLQKKQGWEAGQVFLKGDLTFDQLSGLVCDLE